MHTARGKIKIRFERKLRGARVSTIGWSVKICGYVASVATHLEIDSSKENTPIRGVFLFFMIK